MTKTESFRKLTRCIGIVLGVVVLVVASSGTAVADQSPAGCNANRLSVDIARDVSLINSGDTVNYTVTATNPGSGSGIGCDVTDTDIVFDCPAADGTATGTSTTLTTAGDFAADNSNDTCWSSGSVPLDGCTHLAGLACVVTVNAGVTQANADVQAGDPLLTDKTKGRLHDVTNDSAFSINKGIGVTILQEVGEEFCRTPGFWGTHADADSGKACSQNITQTVLDAAGGSIDVCGVTICNTLVDDQGSAVEAICKKVQGVQTRQLIRQLTAARLNCIVSGETGGACDDISINAVYDACNTACAAGNVIADVGPEEDVDCIGAIDCFNNGGQYDFDTEICSTGTCVVNGAGLNGPAILCGPETPCILGECVPFADNCHQREFPDDFLPNDSLSDTDPCFEKQGPAGSSDECKQAHKTQCALPDNLAACDTNVCDD